MEKPYNHISVLLNESIQQLNIKKNGVYVDCTLGGGGHSSEILKRIPNGHLYAFDEDKNNAFKAGMNGFVPKPIELENLFEELERILWYY